MFYDYEFDFDSFGTVYTVNLNEEESFEQDMMDYYEDDTSDQFFEDQLLEYADSLHDRIRNGEPIYTSQIGLYSDLFKDVYGFRPRGMMEWLTEYDNIIDDYLQVH
jgi:hypothetical protein